MTNISARAARRGILEDLCKYMPGVYFDGNATYQPLTIVKGKWKNCTTYEQMERHWPETINTVQDVALEQGMKDWVGYLLKYLVSACEMILFSIFLLTSQTLLRICRLTINDILSLRVSVWELALSVVTILELVCIGILVSLSLEWLPYSSLYNLSNSCALACLVLIFISITIIIKLVRDADIVVQIGKARDKKVKPKKKLPSSKSVVILKRRPRESVVIPSNVSLDDIV